MCRQERTLLALLIASLVSLFSDPASAQDFRTLHSFAATFDGTNSDGAFPYGALILAGDTLYGTTPSGGIPGDGSVFAVSTSGTGFTNLHAFTGRQADESGFFANIDGAIPAGPLLLSGNILYGTGSEGGEWGNGTVFAVRTNGTGFGTVHVFTPTTISHVPGEVWVNSDGWSPQCHLVLSDGTLYGTTAYGGASGGGTLFRVNKGGTGFQTLHSFTPTSPWPLYANGDGSSPQTGLVLSSNTLYGVAGYGGTSGQGTVFAINTDGSEFRTLHSFSELNGTDTNSDGALPYGQLIASDNLLYGTASLRGAFGGGTVFSVKMDGTDFRTLHNFNNRDGAGPYGGLLLWGNALYGTTYAGGSWGLGTVFKLNTDGTGFVTLHSFTGRGDGGQPQAALILLGNTLYGTATTGGAFGGGTVFSIILRPQLTITPSITPSRANILLTWPTNATGFTLQYTTNLGSSAIWTTNLSAPVVVNGQNTVTRPISGTQEFYRLSQ